MVDTTDSLFKLLSFAGNNKNSSVKLLRSTGILILCVNNTTAGMTSCNQSKNSKFVPNSQHNCSIQLNNQCKQLIEIRFC